MFKVLLQNVQSCCVKCSKCAAKVLQKMHIRKKIEQKFTFKLGFLAYVLHYATVASGELAKPRRRPKVLQVA